MSRSNLNELSPEQSRLLNIYDRLAALGRAMRKSTTAPNDSQPQHSMVANIKLDGTIEQGSNPGIGQQQA
jgi:hypothetical protein